MSSYSKHLKKTPVVPPTTPTHQGGTAYKATAQHQLNRFLTLGSEGGTFYVNEKKLTLDNAKVIRKLIAEDGVAVVNQLVEFTKANRAPKQDPALFVLALCCIDGDAKTRKAAHSAIATIARTSTHLFTFCQTIQDIGKWGRGLRTGVSNFYTQKDDEKLAYQLVKYRQRNGWTHRDVLRLTHPKPESAMKTKLFGYTVGKLPSHKDGKWLIESPIIQGFEWTKGLKEPKDVAAAVKMFSLTWEMIPTEMLNNPEVLEALLYEMPLTAMMRNLNRFAISGLTAGPNSAVHHICKSFTDLELLKKGHIHPITALNAFKVYGSGKSIKGDGTWKPNQKILDSMSEMFELSFQAVDPTGLKILVAVDVSGSMQAPISNLALTCREAAGCLMMTMIRTEPNIEAVYFDTGLHNVTVGKRSSYEDIMRDINNHTGGTDCRLPFEYATRQKKTTFDAITVLTDSEDGSGGAYGGNNSNPALLSYANYKITRNPKCKGILVGMVANNLSLFPAEDPLALQVAGFDAGIPTLINNFLREE